MCDEEQSRQISGEQDAEKRGRSMAGEVSGKTEEGLEGQSQELGLTIEGSKLGSGGACDKTSLVV